MDHNLTLLAFTGLIIFVAFFIRSLTGFGSALISMPLLALLFGLKFALPLITLFEVGISLLLIKSVYQRISKPTLTPMIIGAIVGVALGSTILVALADVTLKKILGGVIILFALNLLYHPEQMPRSLSAYWGGLAGGIGGVFSGMFAVEGLWRVGVLTVTGLMTLNVLRVALSLTPALILGAVLGHKVHCHIDPLHFRRIVAFILVVSGVLLLV
jgi:uncharacterized membrane protein YfcA